MIKDNLIQFYLILSDLKQIINLIQLDLTWSDLNQIEPIKTNQNQFHPTGSYLIQFDKVRLQQQPILMQSIMKKRAQRALLARLS